MTNITQGRSMGHTAAMDRAGEPTTLVLDAAPGPSPPSRWRRRVAIGVAAALAVLVASVLLVPTSVVDGLAAGRVADLGGDCADLVGVDIHSGPWPVAARLLAGRYEDVTAEIDEVRLREPALTYHDVTFTAGRIDVGSLGGMVGGGDEIRIHNATLGFDAIEELLTAYGVTAELAESGGAIQADIVLPPPFGELPTTVHVTAVEGAVELQFVPLDMVTLPPVRIEVPAPTRVTDATVSSDGVHVEATIDGSLHRDDFTCDV
jgi:hypothetical protein